MQIKKYVHSSESLPTGVLVSVLFGIVMTFVLVEAIDWSTHWRLGGLGVRVLSVPIFLFFAGDFFIEGLRRVGFQNFAAQLFFGGDLTGLVFLGGLQWTPPGFTTLAETPGSDEIYTIEIPDDAPEAKDLIPVIIGRKRKCAISVSCNNPGRYIAARNREVAIAAAFLDHERKFVNEMTYAKGLVDEKSLFGDYMALPYDPVRDPRDPDYCYEYRDFRERLRNLTVYLPDQKREGVPEDQQHAFRVFDDSAIETVMKESGYFLRRMDQIGLLVRQIDAPSIEQDDEIEEAAKQKQIQREQREALGTKIDFIGEKAKQLKADLGLTGEDALDRVGLVEDQKITRQVFGFPGLIEAAGLFANALRDGLASMGRS